MGGMVGEVDGYLWMRRWAADATREEAAAAVGGAMGKRKWCVVCPLTYNTLLGEASKIWEVVRKSLGSR